MTDFASNSVANDFSFIAQRLKELQKEKDAALKHDPDAPPPKPAPTPTPYDDYYCG